MPSDVLPTSNISRAPPQDAERTPTATRGAVLSCSCDLTKVTSSTTRNWLPAKRGHIGGTHAPFLSAFLCFLPNTSPPNGPPDSRPDTAKVPSDRLSSHAQSAGAQRHQSSTSWAVPQSGGPRAHAGDLPAGKPKKKGPRPCIIWDPAPAHKEISQVFLMGTFSGTPFHQLPEAIKNYFVLVYTPMTASESAPDWDLLPHIHSSPCWASRDTQYLIPIPVPVHRTELTRYYNSGLNQNVYSHGRCPYINKKSLRQLALFHENITFRLSLMISEGPSAQDAVRTFLREIGPHFNPATGSMTTASSFSTASSQDNSPEGMRIGPSIASTEGQLKPPRAPARTVQPNISYSSIAKRATQSGASTHSTASARPRPERQATIRPERPATVKAERQTTVERERQETIRPERRQEQETTPVGEMKGKSTKAEGGQMAPAPSVKHRAPSVKSNAKLFSCQIPLSSGQLKSRPLERGSIMRVDAHFLAALTGLITQEELATYLKRNGNSSSSFLSHTHKKPRPCIIWNVHDGPDDMVDVFLMGTFDHTKHYHLLTPALRHWVITIHQRSHREDWKSLMHVHSSPEWQSDPSWLIPLVVTVPAGRLRDWTGRCAYINQHSLDSLAEIHRRMQKEYDTILQISTIRELFARTLLDDTYIVSLLAPTDSVRCSSLGAAPASGDLRPASKRKRYDTPETSAPNYGAERGGRSASSQRGASHSRGRGAYQRQANERSTPSLGYNSAGQQSIESLSSMSSRVSANSSSYWTAESGTSGSSIRTGVSHEAVFQGGSSLHDSARERWELHALERRGSNVRAEKRKHSPPTTPTAPRAMAEGWPQTRVPPEGPRLKHPLPKRPLSSFRSELPHLTLPEAPPKPFAQPETPREPFAPPPPETPRKTRAPADALGVLASLKKLSPPSLKNFGRRRSKENAEVPPSVRSARSSECGDPLSPKEPSLRRSSRANSLCSSSRPNSTPSSPKTGKKASALMSPLNKVAHLLRVGGGRPASKAPSEDGRD
ncbi:hypothetical protein K523DRAFT_370195 [Schizophyllum commune Tattone D]|nr:hypothetical protein K523DRAFT_370195 [Schizophyllum commune Tattone D]